MNKKLGLGLGITVLIILVLGITFAFFMWESTDNANVTFTVNGLDEYLVYSKGNDILEDDFKSSNTYLEGVYSSITLYKSALGASKTLYGHFYLNTKSIDSEIINNSAFKWALVKGNNTSETIISEGDFSTASEKGTMLLAKNQILSSSAQDYTLWFWIDEEDLNDFDIEGKNLDTIFKIEVTENIIS